VEKLGHLLDLSDAPQNDENRERGCG